MYTFLPLHSHLSDEKHVLMLRKYVGQGLTNPTGRAHTPKSSTVLSLPWRNLIIGVFSIFCRMFVQEETTLIWPGAAVPDEQLNGRGATLPLG